ncbi:MAG: hypothetical protein J6U66_07520, partial [Lachnospiraceae bacterium]|nr:hypothetical protein [Lachnospiraceae bacterium]
RINLFVNLAYRLFGFVLGIRFLKSSEVRAPKSPFSGIFRVALLFTYQGSIAVICDSFLIIPLCFSLVNHFFQVFLLFRSKIKKALKTRLFLIFCATAIKRFSREFIKIF